MSYTQIDYSLDRWKYSVKADPIDGGVRFTIARYPRNRSEELRPFYSVFNVGGMGLEQAREFARSLQDAMLVLHQNDHDQIRQIGVRVKTPNGDEGKIVSLDRIADTCRIGDFGEPDHKLADCELV